MNSRFTGRGSKAVMHRIANPCRSVRLRPAPPRSKRPDFSGRFALWSASLFEGLHGDEFAVARLELAAIAELHQVHAWRALHGADALQARAARRSGAQLP